MKTTMERREYYRHNTRSLQASLWQHSFGCFDAEHHAGDEAQRPLVRQLPQTRLPMFQGQLMCRQPNQLCCVRCLSLPTLQAQLVLPPRHGCESSLPSPRPLQTARLRWRAASTSRSSLHDTHYCSSSNCFDATTRPAWSQCNTVMPRCTSGCGTGAAQG
jgi:hypothetical protein